MKTTLLLLLYITLWPAAVFGQAAPETFTVQDGQCPWSDRVGTYTLSDIPDDLRSDTPLPQSSCSARTLSLSGSPDSVTFGLFSGDVPTFMQAYPSAHDTGKSFHVVSSSGTPLTYEVLQLDHPPALLQTSSKPFEAGLILLKVEGGSGASIPPAPTPAPAPAPAAPAKTQAYHPPQTPFDTGDKTKLHIYLLMGQSNMVGRDATGLESQATDPRIGYLKGAAWFVAVEPMHAGGSGIGPGIPFARAMLQGDPDGKIGLVPCAVGGTPLSRWVKGADLYEAALKEARIAQQTGVLAGMLWHQGESDSEKPDLANSYETRLVQMFRDFREDVGVPDLPIVVGQLGEFVRFPQAATVEAAITHIAGDLPRVAFADSKGLTDKGDHLHFNADSQQQFGQRYAEAMRQVQQASLSSK